MDENMKRNFKMLLDYQKKDIELRKLLNLLDRDAALAGMNKHKRDFNEAKQTIADCEQQASALLGSYSELQKYVDENEALLAELENSDAVSEEELAQRVKKLDSLKSKFQSADKKMHDIDDKSKSVCTRRSDALKAGKAAQAEFGKAKEKHTALINSKAGEINRLKAELKKMQADLDHELFAEYEKLDKEGKFPAIVIASVGEKKKMFNCGGCGLALSQNGNAQLNQHGSFRCDNCHRIVVWFE